MSKSGAHLDPEAQEYFPRNPKHGIPLFAMPYVQTDVQTLVPFFPAVPALMHYPAHPAAACVNVAANPNPPPPLAHPPPPSASPSRAVVLASVPYEVSEGEIRRVMEVYGEVRGVQMESFQLDGIVTVHFYDLRHAEKALNQIRGMRGFVSAQFAVPETHALPDGNNQGTLVLFNLDPRITSSSLTQIFQAYGAVKELRETPYKKQQRFVEFYDVRDAANALGDMNGREINGKRVLIEFSLPGGFTKKLVTFPPPTAFRFQTQHPMATSTHKKKKKKMNEGSGTKALRNRLHHARFLVSEDAMVDRRDPRTTLMIKNIPNKYSQKLLLNMLDNHCMHCNEQIGGQRGDGGGRQPFSSYDFVYLPIDFNNECNVGYGFVNMTSPQAAWGLYKAFHNHHWEVFNSKKICQVTYARLQGLEALKEHFKNSKFPCELEHYLPVVFSPPRDGSCLSDPIAVVDHKMMNEVGHAPDPSASQAPLIMPSAVMTSSTP